MTSKIKTVAEERPKFYSVGAMASSLFFLLKNPSGRWHLCGIPEVDPLPTVGEALNEGKDSHHVAFSAPKCGLGPVDRGF